MYPLIGWSLMWTVGKTIHRGASRLNVCKHKRDKYQHTQTHGTCTCMFFLFKLWVPQKWKHEHMTRDHEITAVPSNSGKNAENACIGILSSCLKMAKYLKSYINSICRVTHRSDLFTLNTACFITLTSFNSLKNILGFKLSLSVFMSICFWTSCHG